MNSYYLKSGSSFRVTTKESMDLHEKLPAGNYSIAATATGELYLNAIEPFEHKGKLYGDTTKHCDRFLNTFARRTASTGIMLAGEKGSGKSLLGKTICIEGAKLGYPTIVINAPWCGDKFNSFLQTIEQPTIILFDEFEKVYGEKEQEQILTLLDGVYPSKKLFVFTCNDKWRVNQHMRNRPGRIFYMVDFAGLSVDFIREYCDDTLNDKSKIDRICTISTIFSQFNFDMLKALVEDMNRYNEGPEETLKILNVKPEYDQAKTKYNVSLVIDGEPLPENKIYTDVWEGNPLTAPFYVQAYMPNPRFKGKPGEDCDENGEDREECRVFNFHPSDLKKIDSVKGKIILTNRDSVTVILTKPETRQTVHYYNAF